jgi:transposase
MALELSGKEWKVAFASRPTDRPRVRTLKAADAVTQLPHEVAEAKRRLGLAPDARVVSCYEIGYDGFWVHRALVGLGVENLVVDASSIEVNRRARRAKSDGLDADSLLRLLLRYLGGERKAFSQVRVPTPEQEDRRHLHRALETLKRERARLRNRIQGLLATQGVRRPLKGDLGPQLATIQVWDHRPLPPGLMARLTRDGALLQTVQDQITALEQERAARLAAPAPESSVAQVRQLAQLRGIGETSAWVFVMEGLAWRAFGNRREVGGFVGLVPTPYASGGSQRELGISKAGNAQVRRLLNEISWGWLRYQPRSALTQWYQARFGAAGGRARRIGIVALARKLLIALWRYVMTGVLPEGAELKPDHA